MKKQSKAPRKNAAKPPHNALESMTQSEYRAHYERRIRYQKFKALTFGISTDELSQMLDVSTATIRRWRAGTFQPPAMALDLLRIRRGVSLPAVFGDLAGFTIGKINGQTYLIPPGYHWSNGITARDILRFPMLQQIAVRAIAKKPARAGSLYAGLPAANDALPVEFSLEPFHDNAANDGCGYSDQ